MGTYRNLSTSRKTQLRRGAVLVEFALVAILFFTMLLGMIQFGIYQSTANTLWNLSREGARYASVGKPAPTDAEIETHVKTLAPPNIEGNKLTVQVYPKDRASGQPVEVDLTYDMSSKLFFPLVSQFLKRDRTYPANDVRTSTVSVTGGNYFTSSTMRAE